MRNVVSTNPDCRHENRWTEDNATGTEHEVSTLIAAFVTALQPDTVVETGSYRGQTSRAIGLALQENGQGHLHTVEIDGNNVVLARMNTRGLPVTVHHASVYDWTPPNNIEFAFLDDHPDHRYDTFMHLWPHLLPNATVGFHDTGGAWVNVKPDIQRLVNEGRISVVYLPTPRGVAFAQVLKQ